MTTTDRLLEANKELWESYNTHPFVTALRDGTLAKEKFRFYILQDYLYLEDYVKTFAVGIAKAKSREITDLFAGYIAVLTGTEMDIHKGYMGVFNISEEELRSTPRSLDNLSYTSYMLRVAYDEGEAEVLAAVLSCALSYEHIAKKMCEEKPDCIDDPFYGEWVKEYVSDAYHHENVILADMFDRLTEGFSEERIQRLIEIFTICSRYEWMFWEMAWKMAF